MVSTFERRRTMILVNAENIAPVIPIITTWWRGNIALLMTGVSGELYPCSAKNGINEGRAIRITATALINTAIIETTPAFSPSITLPRSKVRPGSVKITAVASPNSIFVTVNHLQNTLLHIHVRGIINKIKTKKRDDNIPANSNKSPENKQASASRWPKNPFPAVRVLVTIISRS